MTYSSLGAKRQPQFADTDAPDLAVNPSQVANYAAEYGNHKSDTAAARTSATSWAWEGLYWTDTNGTKLTYRFASGAWVVAAGIVAVGALGADGNATITGTLTRDAWGYVDVVAQGIRINSTTYATAPIVGILPTGFRPAQNLIVPVLTYGSGSLNHVTILDTGVMSLLTGSPAGHTVAQVTARFRAAV